MDKSRIALTRKPSKRRLPKLSGRLKLLGFSTYFDYLQSDHWRAFKASWVPRRTRNKRPVCEFCLAGHRRLDFHHITYKRLGCELPKDVVLICSRCHSRVHRWFNTGRKTLHKTTRAVQRTAR